MTQSIGGSAYFAAFEEFRLSCSEEQGEIDIIEEDRNFVLDGADEGYKVEITFAVIPEELPYPDRSLDKIEQLPERNVRQNTVAFQGYKGRIAVSDVSMPNQGDVRNLRRGSISGIFLPWPKHFPDLKEPTPGVDVGRPYSVSEYGFGEYGK